MGNADVDQMLTRLIQARPAAAGATDAELITTHISWVVRTAQEVFKLKRPVHYDFVDFSTPALRLQACLEEVRLNLRLAPDVYRSVLPVFAVNGNATLWPPEGSNPGEPIDHVVHMRRLRDEDAAHIRLQEGRLRREHIEALAQPLAAFYAASPKVTAKTSGPGAWLMNLDELAAVNRRVGCVIASAELNAVRAQAQQQTQALANVLRERERFVKDGHGDLRLEHLYFEGESLTPVVIDAVEFEPSFRCGDWALDVAFMAMELTAAGREDLAALLWSCIAREMFDHAFYPLIDLYVVHRAAVRVKVALLLASGVDDKARQERKRQEAKRLWQVALAASQRRHAGTAAIVCVGGVIGSGKSAVANALVPQLLGPSLSSDYTRKALAGVAYAQPAGSENYSEAANAATLQALLDHAAPVLDSGRPVIFDATFRTQAWRAAARALADARSVPFLFVQAECSLDTLRARLRAREGKPGVSDAREALLEQVQSSFEPPSELAPAQHLAVNTELPVAQTVDLIAQRLRNLSAV